MIRTPPGLCTACWEFMERQKNASHRPVLCKCTANCGKLRRFRGSQQSKRVRVIVREVRG